MEKDFWKRIDAALPNHPEVKEDYGINWMFYESKSLYALRAFLSEMSGNDCSKMECGPSKAIHLDRDGNYSIRFHK